MADYMDREEYLKTYRYHEDLVRFYIFDELFRTYFAGIMEKCSDCDSTIVLGSIFDICEKCDSYVSACSICRGGCGEHGGCVRASNFMFDDEAIDKIMGGK